MISIIIPVYNVEKYIISTLLSVFNQTSKNFEVIVIDDGSKDRSFEVAEKEVKKHAEIHCNLIQQKNSGQGYTRNMGVMKAKGEWILFLDADDTIQNFTIELYEDLIQKYPMADLIYSKYQNVEEKDVFKSAKVDERSCIFNREEMLTGFLLRKKVILVPGTLYRRSFLLEKRVQHSGMHWSEDQHFMWQVLEKIKYAVFNNSVTYNYLSRAGSIMHSSSITAIMEGYSGIKQLDYSNQIECVKSFRLARWVFGTLHSAAGFSSYHDWMCLYENMEGEKSLEKLIHFPVKHVALLASLYKLPGLLLYLIFKYL